MDGSYLRTMDHPTRPRPVPRWQWRRWRATRCEIGGCRKQKKKFIRYCEEHDVARGWFGWTMNAYQLHCMRTMTKGQRKTVSELVETARDEGRMEKTMEWNKDDASRKRILLSLCKSEELLELAAEAEKREGRE